MTSRLPDTGPVLAAITAVAGALAGERLGGPGPGRTTVLAAAVALAGAVLLARGARSRPAAAPGGRPRAAAAAGLAGLGLLAAASMQRALGGLDGPGAVLAERREPVMVAARLADDPRVTWGGLRVPARLELLRPEADRPGEGDQRRVRVRILVVARGPTAMRLRLIGAGEGVVLSGRLRPLKPAEGTWRWRHVAAVLEADDLFAARPVRGPVLRAANGLRSLVLRGSDPLPATTRALVAGFLIGDDGQLPPAVAAEFRAAGLSHLLVVSGANVALALALARPALQRLGLLGRLAGGVAVLGLFAAMTRFEPSVLRASAMAGLSLLAAFVGRPASGLRLLALAVVALVLADPFLVHSIGFQLSCGASAGIVLLARPLAGRLPGPGFVRQPLAVTAAAQVGVAPVMLPAFGGLPLVALPANLAAAPAAAALTVWGLGSGLAGGVVGRWWAGGAGLLQVPTGALAGYIAEVAAVAARMPVTVTPAQAKVAAGLAAVTGVLRWAWRNGSRPPAAGLPASALALRWGRRNRSSPPAAGPGLGPAAAGGRARTVPGRSTAG